MQECIYCKRRDPDNYYCSSSPDKEHHLRIVPFDEQVKTTLIGKNWKFFLILGGILLILYWLGII